MLKKGEESFNLEQLCQKFLFKMSISKMSSQLQMAFFKQMIGYVAIFENLGHLVYCCVMSTNFL